jgi:hypothetical protein
MKIIEIDKPRYRRHLKFVLFGCAGGLAIGSLALSQLLIALFPDASGSHFHWNFLGVVITAGAIVWLLNKYRRHNFMAEVAYVWDLKQALNKINRKMSKLKVAARDGNINALLAINFSYEGSYIIWHLDDNTLLLDELVIKHAELHDLAKKHNVTLNLDDYDEQTLKQI